jgi:hypothetical protein
MDLFSVKAAVARMRQEASDPVSALVIALADSFVTKEEGGSGGGVTGVSLIPGQYVALYSGSGGSVSLSNNTVYLAPVWLPSPLHISEIGLYVSTAAAGCTIGIASYTNAANVFTREKDFGAVDAATTGAKAVATDHTLPAGVSWLGVNARGGGPQVTTAPTPLAIPGPWVHFGATLASINLAVNWQAFTFGSSTFPATHTWTATNAMNSSVVAKIMVKPV